MESKITVDCIKGTCHIEGNDFPAVGFGTYRLKGDESIEAIRRAVVTGYRILDTATYYENFKEIARAIRGYERRDLYLISKVWYDQQAPKDLRRDFERALNELETDFLDAYFLHWPNSHIPIEDSLNAMEELRKEGRLRHIGLSNVTVNHMRRALEVGVSIQWVQVEMNPNFFDPALIKFCSEHSIAVQAWAPLLRGGVSEDSLLKDISVIHKKTASQIALRWIIQHGVLPLPSSRSEAHLKENLEVTDFFLTPQEMERIDSRAGAGTRKRVSRQVQGLDDEFDYRYEQCWPKNREIFG